MDQGIQCLRGSQAEDVGKGYAAKAPGLLLASSSPSFLVTLFLAFGMPAPAESGGCQGKGRGAFWWQS